jgi:hypothetical protein
MSLSTIEKAKFTNQANINVADLSAASAGAMGSDTNGVACYTAGSNGGRVESLLINSNDTAICNVFVYIKDGSTIIPLGIVNVPASSGNTAALQNIDAIRGSGVTLQGLPLDITGKPYIPLKGSQILKVAVLANMTAAKHCYVTALGADFSTDPTV